MNKILLMMVFLAVTSMTHAVLVPDASFEDTVADPYYFFPSGSVPGGWAKYGSAGVFVNNGTFGDVITNADGDQVAFLSCTPGSFMFTDLAATVANTDYVLTVGMAARAGQTAAEGTAMELRLFTRPDGSTPVPVAATTVYHADLSTTELTYYTVTLSAQDAAAVAGQNLGLWFYSTAGGSADWTLDNITLVPEPATLALLGMGALVLRRKRS